ncbi:hypothetical protein MIMGU_mgv1a018882mg [Erythranthe guttata]|uniref:ENT domain-containing protein n=1 Tax=Erythranthe guttata TaxID=4155 RepID=A0A022QNQ8_ERYGU|nr:hypothetical protein MIMGU_mgv1a018882mg [Erythranthe guttata]
MRFKVGDGLEVMNRKEVLVPRHTKKVTPGIASDRIAGKSYIAGDIVEVFYQNTWRIAVILNILVLRKKNKFQNQYLVRLLGACSQDLVIDRSNIRMRQACHDDKWMLMKKVSQFKVMGRNRSKKDCRIQEAHVISSRSLKRMSPFGSSIVEAHNAQKRRAVEKEGSMLKHRVVATPVLEKVDAVAYPKEISGEKNMHTSFNIISNGYNRTKMGKQNDVFGVASPELSTCDSDASSVGSCSVTNRIPENYCSQSIPMHCQDTDNLCSDAESSYGKRKKIYFFPPKEELEATIRKLELHAYRSTLEALYASGPLSWEQEAMLTNLRIMLYISNDEHLKELKHLISTKTANID